MKKSLLFLFALFLSLGTMLGQVVWENDPETNSIKTQFESLTFVRKLERNSNSLKINGRITSEELFGLANSEVSKSIVSLDLKDAILDFTAVPKNMFYIAPDKNIDPEDGLICQYKKIVFPESVVSVEKKAFIGSVIERIEFYGDIVSVGDSALHNCLSLREIYLYNSNQDFIPFSEGNSNNFEFTFFVNEDTPISKLTNMWGKKVVSINIPRYNITFESSIFANGKTLNYWINEDSKVNIAAETTFEVKEGDIVTFEIAQNHQNLVIKSIVSNDKFESVGRNVYKMQASQDNKISVEFETGIPVTVFVLPEDGGELSIYTSDSLPVSNGDIIAAGKLLYVVPVAYEGYGFASLTGGNSVIEQLENNVCLLTLPAAGELAIVARFSRLTAIVNSNPLSSANISTATTLQLSGSWNSSDFNALVERMNKSILEKVEFVNCQIETGTIMNSTFENSTRLTSVTGKLTGSNITMNSVFLGCTSLRNINLGECKIVSTSNLVNGCSALRYIYINSKSIENTYNDFYGVTSNLLIYNNDNNEDEIVQCPEGWEGMNFISNGIAEQIELVHGEPFYCPESFEASYISYERSFTKESGLESLAGYESIVLPFTPSSYLTNDNRKLAPWDVYEVDNSINVPFWLMQAADGVNVERASMIPNHPYLICFPNNPRYADNLNINGTVIFSANDAKVAASKMETTTGPAFRLEGTYETLETSSYVYAMSDKGDCFENSGRNIVPFEAYALPLATGASFSAPRLYISGVPSRIDRLMKDSSESYNVYVRSGDLVIEAKEEATITIYSVTGVLVKTVNLFEGENVVSDLNKGIYIVSGKKVII